jgi:hypothetical protein
MGNEITNLNDMQGEFLIYTSQDGNCQIQVKLIDETVWLSQDLMSKLFDTTTQNITMHIANVYNERELEEKATCKDFLQVRDEGGREVSRSIKYYNLDVIISVGYRVKSNRGVQFRQWATQRLREYIIKGFTINKEYLKDPAGKDYFDELLKEIREIRASEKRFYLKIRDIYATSYDYNPQSQTTSDFFAMIQNKLLWAVTGQTAAEIIASRVSADKPHCGVLSFNGKDVKAPDVIIAKNYLEKEELDKLESLTVQYLDFAETQAKNRKTMYMIDWANKLDGLLSLNDMNILTHKCTVKKEIAEKKAKGELKKYKEKNKQIEEIKADIEFAKQIEELKEITKQIEQKNEPLSDLNKKLMQAQNFNPNT